MKARFVRRQIKRNERGHRRLDKRRADSHTRWFRPRPDPIAGLFEQARLAQPGGAAVVIPLMPSPYRDDRK